MPLGMITHSKTIIAQVKLSCNLTYCQQVALHTASCSHSYMHVVTLPSSLDQKYTSFPSLEISAPSDSLWVGGQTTSSSLVLLPGFAHTNFYTSKLSWGLIFKDLGGGHIRCFI